MKISTKGRYALRVMIDLAIHNTGEYIPLRDICQRQNITVKYLEQLIPALNRAGYLESSRGAGGGYRLARPAGQYTAGEILRTMEGSLAPVTCLTTPENLCPNASSCATLNFWKGLAAVVDTYVDSVTLEQLAGGTVTGNDYCI